jgi:hypothetical protein
VRPSQAGRRLSYKPDHAAACRASLARWSRHSPSGPPRPPPTGKRDPRRSRTSPARRISRPAGAARARGQLVRLALAGRPRARPHARTTRLASPCHGAQIDRAAHGRRSRRAEPRPGATPRCRRTSPSRARARGWVDRSHPERTPSSRRPHRPRSRLDSAARSSVLRSAHTSAAHPRRGTYGAGCLATRKSACSPRTARAPLPIMKRRSRAKPTAGLEPATPSLRAFAGPGTREPSRAWAETKYLLRQHF